MSSETPYRFETEQNCTVVSFLPALNDAPWSDIEAVGTDVLSQFSSQKSSAFLVDLSALNYMGSASVALIVRIWKSVQERNGKMVVVNSDEMVLEVLKLAGLTKVWTIVETRQEGLKQVGGRMSAVGGSSGATGFLVLALLALAAAGAGLYFLITKTTVETNIALAMSLGGSALCLVFGTILAMKSQGALRIVGAIILVLGFAAGITSVLKLPQGAAAATDTPDEESEGDEETAEADSPSEEAAAEPGEETAAEPAEESKQE